MPRKALGNFVVIETTDRVFVIQEIWQDSISKQLWLEIFVIATVDKFADVKKQNSNIASTEVLKGCVKWKVAYSQ